MIQVLTKIVLTIVIIAPAVWGVLFVWRNDIDVGRLLRLDKLVTEKMNDAAKWIPTYDPTAVYQDDRIVGRVEGPHIDDAGNAVVFDEINHAELDMGRPIFFKTYELRVHHINTVTDFSSGAPQKGRIMTAVQCTIIGRR